MRVGASVAESKLYGLIERVKRCREMPDAGCEMGRLCRLRCQGNPLIPMLIFKLKLLIRGLHRRGGEAVREGSARIPPVHTMGASRAGHHSVV